MVGVCKSVGVVNLYAYANGNPVSLMDPLGLWSFGDPIPEPWFNYSVGVADGLSFGAGRFIRSFTRYAEDVDTCSLSYKAGVWSGVAGQSLIGTGAAVVAAGGLKSAAQAFYLSSQLLIGPVTLVARQLLKVKSSRRSIQRGNWSRRPLSRLRKMRSGQHRRCGQRRWLCGEYFEGAVN